MRPLAKVLRLSSRAINVSSELWNCVAKLVREPSLSSSLTNIQRTSVAEPAEQMKLSRIPVILEYVGTLATLVPSDSTSSSRLPSEGA